MSSSISIINLCAYHHKHKVLENINLEIAPKTVTALIGPSGCGKTTLLRSINRMHEVDQNAKVTGKLFVNGNDIYHPSVDPVMVRRHVGMVFQHANPFPTMSIRENVLSGVRLSNKKLKKEVANELVEQTLIATNLWSEVKSRLNSPGTSLSGGQQQRLCIARAIAVSPSIILMDEPCSALDPISTLAVEDLIGNLKATYTIVVVTHNMQQASRISDKTAFLNIKDQGGAGSVVEYSDTLTFFSNPVKKETEHYISGNFAPFAQRKELS